MEIAHKDNRHEEKVKDRKKYHYSVLYAKVLKRWEVTQAIQKALPEGRGTVFYPCAEFWMNGYEQTVFRPLFPGYIFIRSDMDPAELHDIIRRCRGEVLSFIKELHASERKSVGEQMFEDGEEFALFDLSEDEEEFMDFLLNFRYEDGGEMSEEIEAESGYLQGREEIWDQKRLHKIPEAGVLRMSYGYREGKKYVVMEGPLKGYEDHIADVNIRDRKAYLDIKINGRIARAGLEIRGKKHWFPNDKYASAVLSDGTEINPAEVAKMMMR